MLAAYHTETPNMTDTYGSIDEVAVDFATTHPVYKMANRVFSQDPAPQSVMVGKRLTPYTKTVDLAPVNVNENFVYGWSVTAPDGTKKAVTYTVQNGDTEDDIVDGLVASAGSITGLTITGFHDASVPSTPATLVGTVDLSQLTLATLNTLTFKLTADVGGLDTTTFTTPTSVEDIVDQINTAEGSDGTASLDYDTYPGEVHLALASATVGDTGTLLVGNGTANATLGFTDNQSATGTNTPSGGARMRIAATVDGTLFDLTSLPKPWNLTVSDVTADPGVATDLQAIADDDDTWYGLALDSSSQAEAEEAASWVESHKKLFGNNTSDSACGDSGDDTDVMSSLAADNYLRTYSFYLSNQFLHWGGLGLMANRFVQDPGTATWNDVTIRGIAADNLRSGFQHAISGVPSVGTHGKKGLVYIKVAGLSVTQNPVMAGEEWIDIIHGRDWLDARLAEANFGAMKTASDNGSRIPFTDDGIAIIKGTTKAVLILAQKKGFLASFTGPDAPLAKDVEPADKHNRLLTPVTWSAILAGAIHAVKINGVLSE